MLTFAFHKPLLGQKILVGEKVVQILYRLGSGSGHGRFEKSDPDPDKNRPDPQHLLELGATVLPMARLYLYFSQKNL
jgi:hypothetical protein